MGSKPYIDPWSSKFTFGLHEGKPLFQVPTGYLQWCLKNIESLDCNEHYMIKAELANRDYAADFDHKRRHQAPPPPPPRSAPLLLPAGATAEALIEIAQAARRALALANHPDVGGDTAKMREINCTADYLEQLGYQMTAGGTSR